MQVPDMALRLSDRHGRSFIGRTQKAVPARPVNSLMPDARIGPVVARGKLQNTDSADLSVALPPRSIRYPCRARRALER